MLLSYVNEHQEVPAEEDTDELDVDYEEEYEELENDFD